MGSRSPFDTAAPRPPTRAAPASWVTVRATMVRRRTSNLAHTLTVMSDMHLIYALIQWSFRRRLLTTLTMIVRRTCSGTAPPLINRLLLEMLPAAMVPLCFMTMITVLRSEGIIGLMRCIISQGPVLRPRSRHSGSMTAAASICPLEATTIRVVATPSGPALPRVMRVDCTSFFGPLVLRCVGLPLLLITLGS